MTLARAWRWAPIVALVAIASAWRPLTVPTGADIVKQMHDKYVGKWFKTLTFVQQTTRPTKSGKDTVQTWYEAASVPGFLRIDFGNPSDGNGALYTHDSAYTMSNGTVKKADAGGNPLIPLLFDVYAVPVDRTLSDLHTLKIDMSKVHQSTYDGRPVYIIGADAGDLKAPQVWIDTERLILVRQVFVEGPDSAPTYIDSQFKKYRPIGHSWIAPECSFFIGDKLIQKEDYTDIKADVPLSPGLFDPAQWKTAPHWLH